MKKKNTICLIVVFAGIMVAFTSCKKEEPVSSSATKTDHASNLEWKQSRLPNTK